MNIKAETKGQETFNVDGEYTPLINGIRQVMPELQKVWKEKCIPAFEDFKGVNIVEYFDSLPVSQRSVEMSKQLGDSINNYMEKLLIELGVGIRVEQEDGYDWVYTNNRETKIEDKNAMSQKPDNRQWVGNSGSGRKVPMHLLKKFKINDKLEIIGAHASLVNLDNTTQYWVNSAGARSTLSFNWNDINGIIPAYGHWDGKKKNLFPRFESIN